MSDRPTESQCGGHSREPIIRKSIGVSGSIDVHRPAGDGMSRPSGSRCGCYEEPCPQPYRLSVHRASQRRLGLFMAVCTHDCPEDEHGQAHYVEDLPMYDGRRAYRLLRRLTRGTRREFPSVGFGPFPAVVQ